MKLRGNGTDLKGLIGSSLTLLALYLSGYESQIGNLKSENEKLSSEVAAVKEQLNQRIKDLEAELAAAKQVQERPKVQQASAAVQVQPTLNPQAPEFVPKLETRGMSNTFSKNSSRLNKSFMTLIIDDCHNTIDHFF